MTLPKLGARRVPPSPTSRDRAGGGSAAAAVQAGTRRVVFVDIVRLIASFQMVNGHTLDALMQQELRQGVIFERYTWVRGLVSVAFLTVAGLAFHLATLARFDAHRADPDAVRRRIRRALTLIAIGYLLKFPGGIFDDDPAVALRSFNFFLRVGVLQCIGFTLLALELMTLWASRARQVVIACTVLALLVLFISPQLAYMPADGPLRPLLNYVSHSAGSPFPLMPWAGYMMAGVALGAYTLPQGGKTDIRVAVRRLACVCAGLWAAGRIGKVLPFTLQPAHALSPSEPSFVLTKLAAVMGVVLVLAVLTARIPRLSRALQSLAAETLTIYVFHLLVLYMGGIGLSRVIGRTLSLPQALGVSAAMIVTTMGYALLWHGIKRRGGVRKALAARFAVPAPAE